jgi:hypothetical protein
MSRSRTRLSRHYERRYHLHVKHPVTLPLIGSRGRYWATRSWAAIAEHYRPFSSFEGMLRLVQHISAAPYANEIFAYTSMTTLVVGQTPDIAPDQEILRVDRDEQGFVLAVQERGFTLDVRREDVVRHAPDGDVIGAFEKLLRAKKWH